MRRLYPEFSIFLFDDLQSIELQEELHQFTHVMSIKGKSSLNMSQREIESRLFAHNPTLNQLSEDNKRVKINRAYHPGRVNVKIIEDKDCFLKLKFTIYHLTQIHRF